MGDSVMERSRVQEPKERHGHRGTFSRTKKETPNSNFIILMFLFVKPSVFGFSTPPSNHSEGLAGALIAYILDFCFA